MDLYSNIEWRKNIGTKFICYYYQNFDTSTKNNEKGNIFLRYLKKTSNSKNKKEHFLLPYKNSTHNFTLMDLAIDLDDNNLRKFLSNYSISESLMNDILMKHDNYLNEMFNKMKDEIHYLNQPIVSTLIKD